MFKQISVVCGGLLVLVSSTASISYAAGNNQITLEATVTSICEIEFSDESRNLTWALNPTQDNNVLTEEAKPVKIVFKGCPDGAGTDIQLISNEISAQNCAKAKNDADDNYMQFCFKDEQNADIDVSLSTKSATNTQSNKATKADETREISVYPQLDDEQNPLAEGTYTGYVTIVNGIN